MKRKDIIKLANKHPMVAPMVSSVLLMSMIMFATASAMFAMRTMREFIESINCESLVGGVSLLGLAVDYTKAPHGHFGRCSFGLNGPINKHGSFCFWLPWLCKIARQIYSPVLQQDWFESLFFGPAFACIFPASTGIFRTLHQVQGVGNNGSDRELLIGGRQNPPSPPSKGSKRIADRGSRNPPPPPLPGPLWQITFGYFLHLPDNACYGYILCGTHFLSLAVMRLTGLVVAFVALSWSVDPKGL